MNIVGPVFEHSLWIAETAWLEKPFVNVEELHRAMCEIVREADLEKQLALIRAHPDLVRTRRPYRNANSRIHLNEQAGAGLNKLSPEQIALFQKQNNAYRDKFGFPS